MNYTGWTVRGRQYTTTKGQAPVAFELGSVKVIPGFNEGLEGMKQGGKRKLIVPPLLQFNKDGPAPVIPEVPGPEAAGELTFEVELVKVR